MLPSDSFLRDKNHVRHLSVSDINPSMRLNLRMNSESDQSLESLILSIRRHGVLEPILVRRISTKSIGNQSRATFEIVCGHRRFEACKKVPLNTIPCVVMDLSDKEAFEVALTENLQREDLNPIEEAEAFKLYVLSFGRGSVSRLAQRIGKSEEYVSHRLLLLGLPNAIRGRISRRLLNASAATELVWLKDKSKQLALTEEVSKNPLSLRQMRAAVRIMRTVDVPASEAVKRAARKRQQGMSTDGTSNGTRSKDWMEGWLANESGVDAKDQAESVLNHAILIVRVSLSGLDFIIEQTSSKGLREILMRQRFSVHGVLDELVKEKVKHLKGTHGRLVPVSLPLA